MDLKFQNCKGHWLCFSHATKSALTGEIIHPVIDDFGSDYDMRDTSCCECARKSTTGIDKLSSIQSVLAERARQDAKWGEQNHEPVAWIGILGEEFGELCEAVNETYFNNGPEALAKGGYENMRAEAVQVAAVAISFIEALDRRYG